MDYLKDEMQKGNVQRRRDAGRRDYRGDSA
jgi:hypothetical protein